jgi:Cu2+-exporting ATPase
MAICKHCGTAYAPQTPADDFCCMGCEYVHHIIAEHGFERYYDLKGSVTALPVKSRPFEQLDFSWLPDLVAKSESVEKPISSLDLSLDGISCIGCVWLIETLFARVDGGIRVAANPAQGRLYLEWARGQCDIEAFLREIARYGYIAGNPSAHPQRADQQKLMSRLGLCGAFALNAMAFTLPSYLDMPRDFMFADLFRLITFASATLSMLVGGSWFIQRAWNSLRAGSLHIDFPIALGLIAAYAGSIVGWLNGYESLLYFDFVAIFVFLMLLGRVLQTAAVDRNRNRIVRQQPVPVWVDDATDAAQRIAVSELEPSRSYMLEPGQANPVNAMVIRQSAACSLEWINGEAKPVHFSAGSRLPAGAILLSRQPLALTATEAWQDSLLSKLIQPPGRERSHAFLDKMLRVWISLIFLIGLSAWIYHISHHRTLHGLQIMISVFVVSCPCALGVALPLADDMAAARLQKVGVFLRSTTFWSRIRRVKHVVFDKTGTLTLDRPVLMNPETLKTLDDRAAAMLANLTRGSLHPVSRTLLEALGVRGQMLLETFQDHPVEEFPGHGVLCTVAGDCWSLGRESWQCRDLNHLSSGNGTAFRINGELIAVFQCQESLRPSAHPVMQALGRHKQVHILSGDLPDKVRAVAASLGIPLGQCEGGLLPGQKADRVKALDHRDTLFIGDGANDSLAFDAAYVTGTPITDRSLLESKADFYILGSGLSYLTTLFRIARSRFIAVRAAFTFALCYNLCVVSLALLGKMNPLLAAILMPLSSLVSIAIIVFLLRSRDASARLVEEELRDKSAFEVSLPRPSQPAA